MEKLYLVIALCLLLCGCNKSWQSNIQLSELKIKDEKVVGQIKNLTKNHYEVTLNLEFKNGSLIEDGTCHINLEPEKVKEVDCLTYKITDDYSVKIEKVELQKKKSLEEMAFTNEEEIKSDDLQTYFEDIYDNHTLFALSLFYGLDNEPEYPYSNTITNYDDSIKIENRFKSNGTDIAVVEEFSKETNDAENIIIMTFYNYNEDDEWEKIKSNLSHNGYLTADNPQPLKILNALKEPTEVGYCYEIAGWCYSYSHDYDGGILNSDSISIHKR